MQQYTDRSEAGRVLGRALLPRYGNAPGVVVLGIPRGGVPVALEVARTLGAPMDIFVVRKVGCPGHEEYGLGAVAGRDAIVLNEDAISALGIDRRVIDATIQRERMEVTRREQLYRGTRPMPRIEGQTVGKVILVDDGLATGGSMQVAVKALRALRPGSLVVAVPVAPRDAIAKLRPMVDDLICPMVPRYFSAVGQWYLDFSQTTDEEVREALLLAASIPRKEAPVTTESEGAGISTS